MLNENDVPIGGTTATITLDPSLEQEQYKVVIVKATDNNSFAFVAISNTITFTNLDEILKPSINYDLFYIYFNDDEKGNYFIYDESGEVGKNEDTEARQLIAYYDGKPLTEQKAPSEYSDLEWEFPEGNTMISQIEGMGAVDNTTAFFSIKRYLDHNASNNIIKLKGIIDGIEYQTSAELRFGSAGDNGSDYKIVLTWRDRKNAYDVSTKEDLIGDITL
jgi:hypothetical protein